MRAARSGLPALILACTAGLASAEVRVDVHGAVPRLSVTPVVGGVWSPRPNSRVEDVLNPMGDLLGHGHPSHVVVGARLLAAWTDPNGTLHVTEASRNSLRTVQLGAARALGTPRLVAWGDDVLVTWQSFDPGSVQASVYQQDGTLTEPVELGTGVLSAQLPGADGILLVLQDPLGPALEIKFVAVTDPGPAPIPIPTLLRRVALHPAGGTAAAGSIVPVCAEWTDDDEALVAWPVEKGMIGMVEVFGLFATDASFQRGPSGSCRSLLNAAAR